MPVAFAPRALVRSLCLLALAAALATLAGCVRQRPIMAFEQYPMLTEASVAFDQDMLDKIETLTAYFVPLDTFFAGYFRQRRLDIYDHATLINLGFLKDPNTCGPAEDYNNNIYLEAHGAESCVIYVKKLRLRGLSLFPWTLTIVHYYPPADSKGAKPTFRAYAEKYGLEGPRWAPEPDTAADATTAQISN